MSVPLKNNPAGDDQLSCGKTWQTQQESYLNVTVFKISSI